MPTEHGRYGGVWGRLSSLPIGRSAGWKACPTETFCGGPSLPDRFLKTGMSLTNGSASPPRKQLAVVLSVTFVFAFMMGAGPGIYLINPDPANPGPTPTWLGMPVVFTWTVFWTFVQVPSSWSLTSVYGTPRNRSRVMLPKTPNGRNRANECIVAGRGAGSSWAGPAAHCAGRLFAPVAGAGRLRLHQEPDDRGGLLSGRPEQGLIVTALTIMATFFSSGAMLAVPGTLYKEGVVFCVFALNLPIGGAAVYVLG